MLDMWEKGPSQWAMSSQTEKPGQMELHPGVRGEDDRHQSFRIAEAARGRTSATNQGAGRREGSSSAESAESYSDPASVLTLSNELEALQHRLQRLFGDAGPTSCAVTPTDPVNTQPQSDP